MIYESKEIELKNSVRCILRSPDVTDAQAMLEYLKTTSGETHFMLRTPNEVTLTPQEETEYISRTRLDPGSIHIAAFIDGEFAGNVGVYCALNFMKTRHRADMGISIKEKYWHLGLGSVLVSESVSSAAALGYEQMNITVYSDNIRALELYKRLGFKQYGRCPDGYRIAPGLYADEILMSIDLRCL